MVKTVVLFTYGQVDPEFNFETTISTQAPTV